MDESNRFVTLEEIAEVYSLPLSTLREIDPLEELKKKKTRRRAML